VKVVQARISNTERALRLERGARMLEDARAMLVPQYGNVPRIKNHYTKGLTSATTNMGGREEYRTREALKGKFFLG